MSSIYGPLSVLSRCIEYKNLTAASKHVGLSQPQLSRLIKKVEEELEVVLLDRSSPRHSSWTPQARALSDIYKRSNKTLETELNLYLEGSSQKEVKIGCLEGLSNLAKKSVQKILTKTRVTEVTLNIYDLNSIEAKFLSGDLDLIFTSKSPGRKKYLHTKELGFQKISQVKNEQVGVTILSPYEDQSFKSKNKEIKKLISNSLAIRTSFQKEYGGTCSLPTEVIKEKPLRGGVPVLVIGQDTLSKEIWNC